MSIGSFKFVLTEKGTKKKPRSPQIEPRIKKLIKKFHENKFSMAQEAVDLLLREGELKPWLWTAITSHPNLSMGVFAEYVATAVRTYNFSKEERAILINAMFKTLIGHWSELCGDVRESLISYIVQSGTNRDILLINLYFGEYIRDSRDRIKSANLFSAYADKTDFLADLFFLHTNTQKDFMKFCNRFKLRYDEKAFNF